MSALWSHLLIAVCLLHGLGGARPRQCERPTIENAERFTEDQEYYDKNDVVTVWCRSGYEPESVKVTCVRPGTRREWTPTVHCKAQCKRPTIENVRSLQEDKEYYKKFEVLSVQCNPGYSSSSDTMRCDIPGDTQEWTPATITCTRTASPTDQCERPTIENAERFSEDQEYYDKYDAVTVWCKSGYDPDSVTVTCMRPGTGQEWTPTATCTAQCKRPTIENVGRLLLDQKYYSKKEVLTVQCKPGYSSSADTMRCDNPGTPQEWTPPTITCTAQCKKPVINDMLNPYPYKISYNQGEEVRVDCISGYYPSYDKMRCDHPHTSQEWAPAITCIEITVGERVTSSSATFRMFCTPSECPDHWRYVVECCDVLYGVCTTLDGKDHVTFAGLQPSSEYSVTITLHNNQAQHRLKARFIRTQKAAPGHIDIVKYPTMQDNTIRWSMPYKWEHVTGFHMNIVARRDYDESFGVNDKTSFPPNVTESKIPLQSGNNYTMTIRAVTSDGAESVRELTTETAIGDPPNHPDNTLGENSALQLFPVPAVNGPISSYEVIVYLGEKRNMNVDCLKITNAPHNSVGTHYTAAVLPAETITGPTTFILGDNKHYNGFHNAPLNPDHKYTVYIRVTSRWKEVEKSSCAFAGVI